MQLTKGMYGNQFNRASRLFGISCGQMHVGEIVHNGGWYNKDGEKLGWGDLSREDLDRIAAGLDEGEVFVILGEQESFWKFVSHVGSIGSMSVVKPDETAPGKAYVAEHAWYVIEKGKVWCVASGHGRPRADAEPVMSREEVKKLLNGE